MKRVLSTDPLTGVTQFFTFDRMNDTFTIHSEQDVSAAVESAKASFNSTDERARWGDWQKVATIPLTVLDDLKKRGIAEDNKKMKAWLNDKDNRYFRTRPGRV